MYNTLMSVLRGRGQKVAAAAYTGIAADLLKGGRTIHSLFKLPVPIHETSTCNVPPHSAHAQMLKNLDLIILDEASMIPSEALRAINTLLQDIMESQLPFGGKMIVLGGDFRQVLPVVRRGSRTAVVAATLKSSPLWRHVRTIQLTQNMRTRHNEAAFAEWLLQLGNGDLPLPNIEDPAPSAVEIPPDCVARRSLTEEVFAGITDGSLEQYADHVILCPKNQDTMAINDQVLDLLPGQPNVYSSVDTVQSDDPEEVAR